VKDNTDQDSWFSAKPIIVGNLSEILVGTEFNLGQDNIMCFILYILGDREDFISEYADSE
jgi:hypothetical protein